MLGAKATVAEIRAWEAGQLAVWNQIIYVRTALGLLRVSTGELTCDTSAFFDAHPGSDPAFFYGYRGRTLLAAYVVCRAGEEIVRDKEEE